MNKEELFFDALKSHRESKDIEVSEICEFTKINPRYIEAIENGEFNVLPTVYMRLFLRAYANFIGTDSEQALTDFELHTTGKIHQRTDFTLKTTEDKGKPNKRKVSLEATSQIAPQQIVTGTAIIIGLFLVLYWAGQITNEQNSDAQKASAPIEDKIIELPSLQETEPIPINNSDPIDGSMEKKSPVIDQLIAGNTKPFENIQNKFSELETTTENEGGEIFTLPNRIPLNANDFLLENIERETTNILKLFAPYYITVTSLQESKLNISKYNNNKLTELINQVVSAGEEFQFDFESTINFEFWNNSHFRVKLNEIPLDNFLSDDGLSIRGSYEANKSQLYLGFYKN